MKTYQFDDALNAINEVNNEHLNILYFYQHIKKHLNQEKLSDERILDLYKLSQKSYFSNTNDIVVCLSKFNKHRVVNLEDINLIEFEEFAQEWTPYEKVDLIIDDSE